MGLRFAAAVICLSLSFAAALRADEPSPAKLADLGSPKEVLTAPKNVTGDFVVAAQPPRICFGILPKQWEGAKLWSAWGDAVWAGNGKVYASIGDHASPHGHSYVYEIDPKTNTMKLVVDVNQVVGLADETKYAPGKIHAPLVDTGDGGIYFVTYRGSVRGTTKELGYKGDWLLRYDTKTGKTKNLGIMVPYSSVPVLEYHASSKTFYGLAVFGKTMPELENTFFVYSPTKRKLLFTAPSPCKMNRALLLTAAGEAYVSDKTGALYYYKPGAKALTKTNARIPGDGTIRAASRPAEGGTIFGISKDGVVFSFKPKTATVTEITKVFPAGRQYTAVCRLGQNDRYLYYVPSAHGKSRDTGTVVVRVDVKTGKREVIGFFHEFIRKTQRYNLGGSFSLGLGPDGKQLFILWNGGPVDKPKNDFGLCAAMFLDLHNGADKAQRKDR